MARIDPMAVMMQGMAAGGLSPEGLPLEMSVDVEMPVDPMAGEEIMIDPVTGEVVIEAMQIEQGEMEQFDANLAETLDEDKLTKIGDEICEKMESYDEQRKGWYEVIRKGMESLGISSTDETAGKITDVTRIQHPLILEAGTQFQARAMAELFPSGGPVKSAVIGRQSEEKLEQAGRVEMHMNYQLTVEDRGYYDNKDQMMYRLPFTGSEFDKQYFDPIKGRVMSRWVKCENLVVPFDASSFDDAWFYGEKMMVSVNDYKKAVLAGQYKDVELGEPAQTGKDAITEEVDKAQGGDVTVSLGDTPDEYMLYEAHCEWDIEDENGIALPYIITVEKETRKVLSIYRNWKEDDESRSKRVWYTHKKFLPGFGFYGWGLFHCIGNMGEAASQIVNILLDAGAFSALQGGFKTKDAKLKGDLSLVPGEYKDTELSAEEMTKAFYSPPFREPSPTLFQLLGAIVEGGQRFAATTEVMVGDAATTGPVGTTVALIEQGSKVFSGIHKRLHKAMGDEFIHIAELNGENLPDQYPFEVEGEEHYVLSQDYDGRVDVIPVSDPNIFSSAQRLATAQAVLQITQSVPGLDQQAAARMMFKAMRVPEYEALFPQVQQPERADPITEGAMAMMGRPLKAFLDQNHSAHSMVHQMQAQQAAQQNPQAAQQIMAHLQEHMAMQMHLQAQQMMGGQLPPVNWDGQGPMAQPLPPEVENQIAVAAAQMAQQAMAQMQQQMQEPQQPQPDPMAEEQRKDFATQKDQERKDIEFQNEQRRRDAEIAAEIERDDFVSDTVEKIDPELLKQAKEYVQATGLQVSPKKLAIASQTLGKPFADVVKALAIMQMGGQGAGPVPISLQGMGRRTYS